MKISELLDDSSKWTHHAYARNRLGTAVMPQSEYAVCWCTTGAIWKCYPANYSEIRDRIVTVLMKRGGWATVPSKCDIADWNDSVSFEQVRSVILEANV